MAIIDDTVGKLARVYDSATDTWIPLVGSPAPHVHNVLSSPDVDITEPLIDNEILAYSTSASAFVNTDSPTFDVATIDTANIDVANIDIASIIQPSTTVKPLIIRSTAPQTASVTAATASSGSVTYEITNAETIFTAGDLVTISGIDPSSLDDVRATVGSVSSGSVVIFSEKTGTYVSGGTATRIHANLLEIQNSAGTPTSTIRSDGSVTGELTGGLVHINTTSFSAVASQSINGVFSADYENYFVKIDLEDITSNADALIRLRTGSTDATTNYLNPVYIFNSAGATGNFLSTNGWKVLTLRVAEPGLMYSVNMDIHHPFLTKPTTQTVDAVTRGASGHVIGAFGGGVHEDSTSYSSFSLVATAGAISGRIRVYGYKD
jgi:hypothetical protein